MTVISFRNVIMWPRIPRLTAGVKLHDQPIKGNPPPDADNVVVLPVVHIAHKANSNGSRTTTTYPAAPSYNDIQKIIAKTMRAQRYDKRSDYAITKLRAMFLIPG